jgi:hypothetical protein
MDPTLLQPPCKRQANTEAEHCTETDASWCCKRHWIKPDLKLVNPLGLQSAEPMFLHNPASERAICLEHTGWPLRRRYLSKKLNEGETGKKKKKENGCRLTHY